MISRSVHVRPSYSTIQTSLFCLYSSLSKNTPRLRIIFAGSDNFSATSLQALHREHVADPSLIASIDVLCREDGRTGRKRDILKEVPIKAVARSLKLPLHTISTFEEWKLPKPTPSEPFNLLIAVSFGLFVPAALIEALPYGGLNVHPSLLPRYRGAAPVQRTLLNHDVETGVTVQTLDKQHFDRGTILLHSSPTIAIPPRTSYHSLLETLAVHGAELLIETLRRRLFVPPISAVKSAYLPSFAPKVTSEDRHISWEEWSAEEMALRAEMLGSVWTELGTELEGMSTVRKRTILTGIAAIEWEPDLDIEIGCFRYIKKEREEMMLLRCKVGWARVGAVKVEGKKEIEGGMWVRSLQKRGLGRKFY